MIRFRCPTEIMKLTLALIALFCSLSVTAQKAVIKFCPPALIDIVGFPTVQMGLEYTLSKRVSWYNELGIKYFEPQHPDTSFIGSKGFKVKTELRYYLRSKRARFLARYTTARPMEGIYLAANAFYTYNTFNTQINYLQDTNRSVRKTDCFGVRKKVWGFNLVFGWQKSISKKALMDLYAGPGIRFRYITDINKEYNADRDVLMKSIDLNIRSTQDEINSKEGFSVAPNLTLGIRFCYRL